MSLRVPQVCATSRLERSLQCVVVILRLAARRIMLVSHEWTLSYSRGIDVVVTKSVIPWYAHPVSQQLCILMNAHVFAVLAPRFSLGFLLWSRLFTKFLRTELRVESGL